MRRTLFVILPLLATLAAAEKGPRREEVWVAPDFASFAPRAIAMLPAATYDDNAQTRKAVETALAQSLRGTGYRWVSTLVTRDQLMRAGGDSLVKALNAQLLKVPRLDSLQAPFYCRTTRASALLTVRVDRYEKLELEFNQAGKPTTTVGLSIALVDSTGRLLWTASGSETAEGPYQDPTTGPVGVKASGLNTQPVTGQGGAPGFPETLNRLIARWVPAFPPKVAPPAPAN